MVNCACSLSQFVGVLIPDRNHKFPLNGCHDVEEHACSLVFEAVSTYSVTQNIPEDSAGMKNGIIQT